MLNGKNYTITKGNIMAHELIGLEAKALRTGAASARGLVVDETKNTIVLESNGAQKAFPKHECVFEFALGEEVAIVQGKDIMYSPENRVKALWRN